MRRKKKKGESVCTRTGKKKRLRRQSGVKEEQKKNYDPFQFMQRRNLSFLLFSLSLLLGLFFFVLKKNFRQQHCTLCVVCFLFFLLYFIYFVCAKRRRRQNLGIPLILMYIRKKKYIKLLRYVSLAAMRNLFMYVLFKGLIWSRKNR